MRRDAESGGGRGPGAGDAAERALLLKVAVYFGPPCFVMLTAGWSFLYAKGALSGAALLVLLVANIPLTAAGIALLYRATGGAATALVRTLFASGDIAPPASYPRQEMLIAQGRYAEAADYYRDHLTVEPADNVARLRLAALLEAELGDPATAERVYLEVRRCRPAPREALAAANGLIDLYRRTGRRDRLKVELARFADRYRGTAAGEAAARELKALKAEDTPPES